jgi:hypothetical protein
MLVIRDAQLLAFHADLHRRSLEALCRHVRDRYPEAAADLDDAALRAHVSEAVERAAAYGLRSFPAVTGFLHLCALYGWMFHADAANAWMRDRLGDPRVSDPEQRLDLLVRECLHRREVATQNERVASSFLRPRAPLDPGAREWTVRETK